MTEWNLSHKIIEVPKGLHCACGKCDLSKIHTKDVKEFIRKVLLALDFLNTSQWREANARIEELAGDRLI